MTGTQIVRALAAATLLFAPAVAPAAPLSAPGPAWQIQGELSESCTCSVPCSCNFGEAPSPHSFCWALIGWDIQKGRYGNVKLDGLRLAAGDGAKGVVFYIDERATPAQAAALQAIGTRVWTRFREVLGGKDPAVLEDPFLTLLGFKRARIEQEVGKRGNRLIIGEQGGFEGDYIIGLDGKTPLVVENQYSWNIQHGIKGKSKRLHYKDEHGNEFDMTGTNVNQGKFNWTDKTPIYFQ
jgi:hypothetical protein